MVVETIYCDRCGKVCEEYRDNRGLHLYPIDLRKSDGNYLDLCQNCYDSLNKWWTEGKIKSEET